MAVSRRDDPLDLLWYRFLRSSCAQCPDDQQSGGQQGDAVVNGQRHQRSEPRGHREQRDTQQTRYSARSAAVNQIG